MLETTVALGIAGMVGSSGLSGYPYGKDYTDPNSASCNTLSRSCFRISSPPSNASPSLPSSNASQPPPPRNASHSLPPSNAPPSLPPNNTSRSSPLSNASRSSPPSSLDTDFSHLPSTANNTSPSLNKPSRSTGNSVPIIVITVTTIIGVLMLIATITFMYIKRKQRQEARSAASETALLESNGNGDSKIQVFLQDLSKESPRRFTSQQLTEITSNYARELGAGGFGRVYEGKLKDSEILVAVKVLHGSVDSSVEAQFIAEVGSMWRTNHVNLVKLYGFCFDSEVKALVCEYMDNGSLDQYLTGKKGWLEFERLYKIAVGTARGIRYLHEECQKKIIHYDIKPANVLLTKNFSAKVGDFGLAELLDRETTLPIITNGRGTPGFVAPELSVSISATHKCDVYSFGMLLFEMLGSRRKREGKQAENQEWSSRWVKDKINKGETDSIMSICGNEEKDRVKAERMCRVALMCVQYQPEMRPSMSKILMMLEGEEETSIAVPLNNLISL